MQPQNPNHDFDFMLNNQPPAKRSLGLPTLSKPVKIVLAALGAIILLIGLGSLFAGGKGAPAGISGSLARGVEIQRVTASVQQLGLQDPSIQALSATVSTSLSSDQIQLTQYLKSNKSSLSKAQLAADADKSTDAQMQAAAQANNLDKTYTNYLRQSLADYSSDLQKAYGQAGPKGQAILKSSFDGANTLLTSPPLKS